MKTWDINRIWSFISITFKVWFIAKVLLGDVGFMDVVPHTDSWPCLGKGDGKTQRKMLVWLKHSCTSHHLATSCPSHLDQNDKKY